MHTPITYLRVFLTSLLFSLSWHYYTSVYFLDFLGHILMGSAAIYLGMYLLERWGRANSQLPRRTRGQQLAFWNLAVFILLIFVSQLISFIQFQFTYKQYLIQQTVYVAALAIGLFCLWRLRRRPASSLIQIPILFSSALLSYEIYLTTTAPNPNQTTQLAPVLEGGFVSYGGGNGRLINTHYGLPQRRYLSPFVPGQQSFRPPTQADLASRIEHDFGTTVLAPIEGTVISTIDSLPDLPPGTIDDSHPPGNHLCIQIDAARYLYLANFQQDSITVQPGDSVEVGQVLGKIGKNGSFSESAIIVLLVDNPNVIDPKTSSLPYYFRNADGSLQFPKRNALINQR
jgi:Sugar phosphate permease